LGEYEGYPTSLREVLNKWRNVAVSGAATESFAHGDFNEALFDMLSELLGEKLVQDTGLGELRKTWMTHHSVGESTNAGELGDFELAKSVWACLGLRRFFRSPTGYIGLAPVNARPEHLLCILFGCSVPCVLATSGSDYIFVGTAHIHGLMHGKAINMMEKGQLKREAISII
jgi:hypothetical protein